MINLIFHFVSQNSNLDLSFELRRGQKKLDLGCLRSILKKSIVLGHPVHTTILLYFYCSGRGHLGLYSEGHFGEEFFSTQVKFWSKAAFISVGSYSGQVLCLEYVMMPRLRCGHMRGTSNNSEYVSR